MAKVLLGMLSVALFALGAVFALNDGSKPSVLGDMTTSSGDTTTGTDDVNFTMSKTATSMTVPFSPTGLTARWDGSGIKMTWASASGGSGSYQYKLYRNGAPYKSTTLTEYRDSDVTPGFMYSYFVVAKDEKSGFTSGLSNVTPAVVVPITTTTSADVHTAPTDSPKTDDTIPGTTSADVHTAPTDSPKTDDTIPGTTSAVSSSNAVSSSQTSSTDTILMSGHTSSATFTRTVSEDTIAPSAPTGVKVEFIGPMTVRVRWQPSIDNVGVANYLVFRNGEHIGTVYDTRYDDVSVQPGKQYAYAVVATDIAKNQSRKIGLREIIVPDGKDEVPKAQDTALVPVVLTVNRVPDPVEQTVDSDHDDLSNDEEARLGTDPSNLDTDGDGYKDGDEIKAGFDPLKFSPGDKRDKIVFQLPKSESLLEQSSLLDTRYAVTDIKTVKTSDTKKDVARFSGKGLPNSFVTLYIYSEPIVVVVKTDENGNWQYDLDKNIESGDHEVYVAVTDTLGRITAQSSPIPFVKTAEAITVKPATFPAQAVRANQSPIDRSVWQYIGVGVALATVFIAIALAVIRRRQQSVMNE